MLDKHQSFSGVSGKLLLAGAIVLFVSVGFLIVFNQFMKIPELNGAVLFGSVISSAILMALAVLIPKIAMIKRMFERMEK